MDANVNLEGEAECNDNDFVTQEDWKERDDREDQNYDDGNRDDELNGPIPVRHYPERERRTPDYLNVNL